VGGCDAEYTFSEVERPDYTCCWEAVEGVEGEILEVTTVVLWREEERGEVCY